MTDRAYPLALAISDLDKAGLLLGVWSALDGRLSPRDSATYAAIETSFSGAGLDSRHLETAQLFVALPGDQVDGRDFIGTALSSGHWALAGQENRQDSSLPWTGMRAAEGTGVLHCTDGVAALQLLASCHRRRWQGVMIGITGTNGKTTCKDFCGAMLGAAGNVCVTQGNHNNRLGVPLTLLSLSPEHKYAVVEMGASAEGDIAALSALVQPRIGIITNAADAHLAEFGSLAGIIRGKGELLDALPENGTAVLNADSPGFELWCERARCSVESWGTERGRHRWQWRSETGLGWSILVDGDAWPIPLPGRHNGANLIAALLAVRAAGLTDSTARGGLRDFQGSAHRGRLLRWAGRLILDDCYNANPRSMLASGSALLELAGGGRSFAVLGAMAELGEQTAEMHFATGKKLAESGIRTLVAVGAGAESLGLGFDAGGGEAHYCTNHEEAARWIREHTVPGDVILLKGSRSSVMELVMDSLPGITPVKQGM